MNEEQWRYEFDQSMIGVAEWIYDRLINKLENYDLVVTGELKDSLDIGKATDEDADKSILTVHFADHGFIMNYGAKGQGGNDFYGDRSRFVVGDRARTREFTVEGGKFGVAYRDILQWTKDRGIQFVNKTQQQTASAITKSVRFKGIEKRPWLDDVLIKELPEIDRRIEKALDATAEVGLEATANFVFSQVGRRIPGNLFGRQRFR